MLPRASNKPSHLFYGVWASRYSRLYDFLHRLYRIELATSSTALPVPLFLRGEHHSEKDTISCVKPHSVQLLPRRRGKLSLSCGRLLPDDRPATSPVLAAAAFAQHISYGPVMYENLLLPQTAETPILPLPLYFNARRSDGYCALVTLSHFAHWFQRERWRYKICHNTFLTLWP